MEIAIGRIFEGCEGIFQNEARYKYLYEQAQEGRKNQKDGKKAQNDQQYEWPGMKGIDKKLGKSEPEGLHDIFECGPLHLHIALRAKMIDFLFSKLSKVINI